MAASISRLRSSCRSSSKPGRYAGDRDDGRAIRKWERPRVHASDRLRRRHISFPTLTENTPKPRISTRARVAAPLAHSSHRPIFCSEPRHAREFAGVRCHQHRMTQARLGCDQHIIGTDQRPRSLKRHANFGGLLGRLPARMAKGLRSAPRRRTAREGSFQPPPNVGLASVDRRDDGIGVEADH